SDVCSSDLLALHPDVERACPGTERERQPQHQQRDGADQGRGENRIRRSKRTTPQCIEAGYGVMACEHQEQHQRDNPCQGRYQWRRDQAPTEATLLDPEKSAHRAAIPSIASPMISRGVSIGSSRTLPRCTTRIRSEIASNSSRSAECTTPQLPLA